MFHTFEGRLTVNAEMDALLAAQDAHWSWGLRNARSLPYRQRLTRAQAYAELTKLDFTSHPAESALSAAEMKRSGLVEFRKYQLKQLKLAVLAVER